MKKYTLIYFIIFMTTVLSAQEDSFFTEDEYFEDESSSFIDFSYGGSAGANVKINEDFINTNEYLDLDLSFTSSFADVTINSNFELEGLDDIKNFPLQNSRYSTTFFIDTAFIRFYHSMFDLEIGLLKPIWGNADGVHAVDVLNPLDYSNLFGTTYLESKISQQMVKLNIPLGESLLEFAYLPTFNGDNIPLTGIWAPYYVKNMEETIYQIAYGQVLQTVTSQYPDGTAESVIIAAAEAQTATTASDIAGTLTFDKAEYLKSSQLAARFTTSVKSFDLGLTYYYGFLKQPTIDPKVVFETQVLTLIYNKVQTFGFDFATALSSFNLKGEVAYNLTNDISGDNSGINNNSIKYILGFDVNVPVNNINVLFQGVVNTILSSNKITTIDPEYNANDEYTSISVMARLSDNYLNEKLYLEVSGVYNIYDNDFMIKPKAIYHAGDNSLFYIECLLLEGEGTTTFGQYNGNDTLKIGFDYKF